MKRQRVVESYGYSSFGQLKRHGDKVKNSFTYTGREWNKEAGLYYFRNRYQDAVTGRFLTVDPSLHLRGSPEIPYSLPTFLKTPQKLNPYLFALSNPLRFTDPFGLDVQDCYRPLDSVFWPLQYHRYLWIDGIGVGLTTADGSLGITTTPGRLKPDNATSGWGVHCVPVPATECQKECLKRERDRDDINPPNYNLYSYNCHTWVSDIFNRCGIGR
ncbi:MAG TPA: RHS repeat-associated core domain-containing protein [Clostridia bacterium]